MYAEVLETAQRLKEGQIKSSKETARACLLTIEQVVDRKDFDVKKEEVVMTLLLPGRPLSFNFLRAVLKLQDKAKIKRLIKFGLSYLDSSAGEAVKHGLDIIREGDRIMTASRATNVVSLLREAHKTRNFSVLVVESRPDKSGRRMAQELMDAGIKTTLICDAAVNYFMPEVDKVIVGGVAVTSFGLIDHVGVSTIAVCAAWHRVPFYAVVEYLKVSDRLIVNEEPPREICDHLPSRNPAYDLTRTALITEYVTDLGRFPSAKFYETARARVERLIS